MKNLISLSIIVAFIAMFTACSPKNDTPTAVATEYMSLMKAGKYEKVADLTYVKPGTSAEDEAQGKAMIASMLKEKAGKQIEKKGGIKSFEIISEKISESGEKATVEVTTTYGDNSTEDEICTVKKGEDNKWYLDM